MRLFPLWVGNRLAAFVACGERATCRRYGDRAPWSSECSRPSLTARKSKWRFRVDSGMEVYRHRRRRRRCRWKRECSRQREFVTIDAMERANPRCRSGGGGKRNVGGGRNLSPRSPQRSLFSAELVKPRTAMLGVGNDWGCGVENGNGR